MNPVSLPHAPAEVLDPVCGMTIAPADAVGTSEYRRQTYYFCSESCLEQFRANPAQFVDAPRKAIPADAAANVDADYTCPMHPEIRQKGPGSCPNLRDGARAGQSHSRRWAERRADRHDAAVQMVGHPERACDGDDN